jgi:hypothetical protein
MDRRKDTTENSGQARNPPRHLHVMHDMDVLSRGEVMLEYACQLPRHLGVPGALSYLVVKLGIEKVVQRQGNPIDDSAVG